MNLIQKVFIGIKSVFLQIKYSFINLFSKRAINIDNQSDIYISLTSYGKRIDRVFLTIESIIACRSLPFNSITLWLSEKDISPEKIPNSLNRLIIKGLKIKFVKDNIKSYKKLYYQYEQCLDVESAIFVTADDDVYYPRYWLSDLYKSSLINPETVICFRGKYINIDSSNSFLPYSTWPEKMKEECHIWSKKKLLLPTGVGGVLYPKMALTGLTSHYNEMLTLCPSADDVWFKIQSLHNGFGASMISESVHFPPVLSLNMKGLELYNINQGGNDIQFEKTTKYFKIKYTSFFNND